MINDVYDLIGGRHFRAALDEVGVTADKTERVMKLLESKRGAVLNR